MTVTVLHDAAAVADHAAALIAEEARAAVQARGHFTVALSGGRTPWMMLDALSAMDVPWTHVHVLQVDERIAPEGHPDRNLSRLKSSLAPAGLDPYRIHAMPVEQIDPHEAARCYARTLADVGGTPPVLDLIHLGLGADGHTASLVPGDPVLDVTGDDVAVTAPYQGRRRLTLTYPVLNRARRVLWVVTGEEKAEALTRLELRDPAIPAGRVRQDHAVILADQAAARWPVASPDRATSDAACGEGDER